MRFHKILFQKDTELSILKNKNVLFLKKKLSHCQFQNKKALFDHPIFSEGFGLEQISIFSKSQFCRRLNGNILGKVILHPNSTKNATNA